MNCEQCLGTGHVICVPAHAMKALGAIVVRAWRGMLAALAELG